MHYFLYPTKDTYLSNDPTYINKNVGLDEILQVDKSMSAYGCASVSGSLSGIISRTLLQFNLLQISQSIAAGKITSASFFLNLRVCESNAVAVSYDLVACPVSKPWIMGTGYKYDGSTTADGATWKFRDVSTTMWVTGSAADCSGGGTWFSSGSIESSGSSSPMLNGYACSQSFNYQSSDVKMDVTTIVNAWLTQSVPNCGLIVMHADESSSIDYGSLKFFSKETNTVYSPYLDVAWDDSVFSTGSADEIDITDAVVNIKNMAATYKYGSVVRFNVTPRQRYPIKTFTNDLIASSRTSNYLAPHTDSFFRVL